MSSTTIVKERLLQARLSKSLVTESAISNAAPVKFGPLDNGTYLVKATVEARIDHDDVDAAASLSAGWILVAGAVYPIRVAQSDEKYVSVIATGATPGIVQLLQLVED